MLVVLWGNFGSILWVTLLVTLGYFGCNGSYFGGTTGSFRWYTGIIFRELESHFGITLRVSFGVPLEHFGYTLGSLLGYLGGIFGCTLWVTLGVHWGHFGGNSGLFW